MELAYDVAHEHGRHSLVLQQKCYAAHENTKGYTKKREYCDRVKRFHLKHPGSMNKARRA